MGAVMIRCPHTGYAVATGYEADPEPFRKTPVFYAITYCPICREDHQWFAGDAWVREQADASTWRDAGRAAPVCRRRLALAKQENDVAIEDSRAR